jgi:hypothetical protein
LYKLVEEAEVADPAENEAEEVFHNKDLEGNHSYPSPETEPV